MLFSLKNPLKRRISEEELFRSREDLAAKGSKGAFIGASLVDRKGIALSLDPARVYRVSGNIDTLAPDLAVRLLSHAIEAHRSILLIDFQIAEMFWHRFWATSFYHDRAADFRLIELGDAERSDVLGEQLNAHVAE